MKTIFDSIFKRNGYKPRYGLYDTWEPKIENELSLAVSSFHADKAFHSVFGEDRVLDKTAVAWHFIGWILDRRRNPMAHMVTVRRDNEFKALLSGSLGCGASRGDELRTALLKKDAPRVKQPPSDNSSYREQEYKRLAILHDAIADKQLEDRMRQYSKLGFRSLSDLPHQCTS